MAKKEKEEQQQVNFWMDKSIYNECVGIADENGFKFAPWARNQLINAVKAHRKAKKAEEKE